MVSIQLHLLHILQERITSTDKGSVTSVQSVYVPADDLTDPAVVAVGWVIVGAFHHAVFRVGTETLDQAEEAMLELGLL